MNQASRLWVLLLLVVFVSGCGFTITAPRDYALGDEPKDGLVIVSFTQPPHERVFWMYRDPTKGKGLSTLFPNLYERKVSTGEHPDVSTPIIDGDTRMIAVVLPQGDYEFYRWHAPYFGYSWHPVKDFSVRFTSVAGRAVYIGNLFVPMEGRRFRLVVRDRRESEIPLFRKHYPKVADTQIETRLMHVIGPGELLEASVPRLTALRAR
jgi:hypothetical protein